jgi:breast cancer 2 susceptibility protein
MDFLSAASFVFPSGHSAKDAFAALQSLVAERMPEENDLVTLPWVHNHWSMIVWKLASYVRSRPDLKDEWWTFERAMDQLRYRFVLSYVSFPFRVC